jgi:hypothetical protein
MIHPLRQRHRHIFMVLGVFLPVAFTVGIAVRKPAPLANELPAALAVAPQAFENIEWQRADLFAKSPVQLRLLRGQSGTGTFAVAFSTTKDFVKPDLLVYWVAGNSNLTNSLPDNAILLGAFTSTPLLLPDNAAKSDGLLLLYSLADNEIVDVSKSIRFNDSTK